MTEIPVALEGLPFVGKSSSARALASDNPQVMIVADYHELIDRTERIRFSSVAASEREQSERVSRYERLDQERWAVADRHLQQKSVVFDRSYVSIMAYDLAIRRTFFNHSPDPSGSQLLDPAIRRCRVPSRIVFIEIPLGTAIERHYSLATGIDQRLRTPEFLRTLIWAYEQALSGCESLVKRVDGTQPLDSVVTDVRECVYGKR